MRNPKLSSGNQPFEITLNTYDFSMGRFQKLLSPAIGFYGLYDYVINVKKALPYISRTTSLSNIHFEFEIEGHQYEYPLNNISINITFERDIWNSNETNTNCSALIFNHFTSYSCLIKNESTFELAIKGLGIFEYRTISFRIENLRNQANIQNNVISSFWFYGIAFNGNGFKAFSRKTKLIQYQIYDKVEPLACYIQSSNSNLDEVSNYTFWITSHPTYNNYLKILFPDDIVITSMTKLYVNNFAQNFYILDQNMIRIDLNKAFEKNMAVKIVATNLKNPQFEKIGFSIFSVEWVDPSLYPSRCALPNQAMNFTFQKDSSLEVKLDNNFVGNDVELNAKIVNSLMYDKDFSIVFNVSQWLIVGPNLTCNMKLKDKVYDVGCKILDENAILLKNFNQSIQKDSEIMINIKGYKLWKEPKLNLNFAFHFKAYHSDYRLKNAYEENQFNFSANISCCSSCNNSISACQNNSSLPSNTSVSCVSPSFLNNNSECIKCQTDAFCSNCNPFNLSSCLRCKSNYTLVGGYCLPQNNTVNFIKKMEIEKFICNNLVIIDNNQTVSYNSTISTNYTVLASSSSTLNNIFFDGASSNMFYITIYMILTAIGLLTMRMLTKKHIDILNYFISFFSVADQVCLISLLVKFSVYIYSFLAIITGIILSFYYVLHLFAIFKFRKIFRVSDGENGRIMKLIKIIDICILIINYRMKFVFFLGDNMLIYRIFSLDVQVNFYKLMKLFLEIQLLASSCVVATLILFVVSNEESKTPSFFFEYLAFSILFLLLQIIFIFSKKLSPLKYETPGIDSSKLSNVLSVFGHGETTRRPINQEDSRVLGLQDESKIFSRKNKIHLLFSLSLYRKMYIIFYPY